MPTPPDTWLLDEWDAVSDAYDAVDGLAPGEREAAVEALPGPVRRGVRALLAVEGRAEGRPDRPAPLDRGTALGRFVVRRPAGSGGTADVYAAEDDEREQWAAVKVLTATGPDAARRFALEQRLLAALDGHPAVPTFLGAGTAPDGRPYFAMEYVDGLPVTAFARSRSLGTVARLELFALVCDAVRHAHRRGVVHRDVKASNVFASEGPDGRLRVHLLDFGAAKPLADGAGPGALTRSGLAPATPAYAAPEQWGGGPTTTSTDVFALGLLLHELLTGRNPLDDGPPAGPPSSEIDLGLGWALARSVDAVARRAVDPDPSRRYASADDLLHDLHLVLAGRTPPGVRLGLAPAVLWVAAKRGGLATAALAVAVVVGAFAFADARWRSGGAAAAAAERRAVELAAALVRSAPPGQARPFLVGAAEAVRDRLADGPGAQGDLTLVVADELARRGACDEAAPLYGRAVVLREASAPDHPVVVAGLRGQARCAAGLGGAGPVGATSAADARRAAALAGRALALARARYGPGSAVAAAVGVDLALYHALSGEPAESWHRLAAAEAALGVLAGARPGGAPPGEARRLRAVRERAGTPVVVFPDVEGVGGVAVAAARAAAVAAVGLTAEADYGRAAARARAAARPLLPPSGSAPPSDAAAEVAAFALATEADALRRAGAGDAALAAAARAAAVLADRFGEGDPRTLRARADEAALAAETGGEPLAPAVVAGLVRGAEEAGDDGLLSAVLQAHGAALLRAGRPSEARTALERAASVGQGAEPRARALALAALADLDREGGDVASALDRSDRAVREADRLPRPVGLSLDARLAAATARAAALRAAGRPGEAAAALGPVLRDAEGVPAGPARAAVLGRARAAASGE